MADDIKTAQAKMIADLVSSVSEKGTDIAKLKEMTRLARELGEDTGEADKLLATAEDFLATIKKRFGTPEKK